MVQKIDKNPQLDMFRTPIKHFIQESHKLVKLARQIDWDRLENELSEFYCSNNGRPGIPIRKIAGMLMLKRMFNESDESVIERWVENPIGSISVGRCTFSINRLLIVQS